MKNDFVKYMRLAIQEAEISLREGNHGFGAVIIRNHIIIAQTHDTDVTDTEPTAHAELKAIRQAAATIGNDLSDCVLVSTHEPCPMCAGAIVWSKIKTVVYGYGISDALTQGRNRIDISCAEIFKRAKARIRIIPGILQEDCAILYHTLVRDEIKKLRKVSIQTLKRYNNELATKRLTWYKKVAIHPRLKVTDPKLKAYRLLLMKFNITENEAPIVMRNNHRIIFHSKNFCPTLEACTILGLDTKKICKRYNEGATNDLIRQIDSHLWFSRNYAKLRPEAKYCEEMIEYRNT